MTSKPDTLTIRRPDDWHIHLRDGDILNTVLPYTSRYFNRAIVMPNLTPPITTVKQAQDYRGRIMAALPNRHRFTPLMTCYLTDTLSADELEQGFIQQVFTAAKLYPAHATTNSSHGVTSIEQIVPVLERMEQIDMPLLIHGEVNSQQVDIFDREARFIDDILIPLRRRYPRLRIVLEHITTRQAAEYVRDAEAGIAATITPQHLALNRNHMLSGGIRPHLYCLPILKRQTHQQALCDIIATGHQRFFLGTDTAPHLQGNKESHCGCAGIFNAPVALSVYTQIFEDMGALAHLEAFCSLNGPAFYRLPVSENTLRLTRQPWIVPDSIATSGNCIIPFMAGQTLSWSVQLN